MWVGGAGGFDGVDGAAFKLICHVSYLSRFPLTGESGFYGRLRCTSLSIVNPRSALLVVEVLL